MVSLNGDFEYATITCCDDEAMAVISGWKRMAMAADVHGTHSSTSCLPSIALPAAFRKATARHEYTIKLISIISAPH